jgi:hypothetical protein
LAAGDVPIRALCQIEFLTLFFKKMIIYTNTLEKWDKPSEALNAGVQMLQAARQ